MIQFTTTQHNGTFLEIYVFASLCSRKHKLCSVVISSLYYQLIRLDSEKKQYMRFLKFNLSKTYHYTVYIHNTISQAQKCIQYLVVHYGCYFCNDRRDQSLLN